MVNKDIMTTKKVTLKEFKEIVNNIIKEEQSLEDRRLEIFNYIKEYGVINNKEYEAYLNQNHFNKLKEFKVVYKIVPINEIYFGFFLEKFLLKNGFKTTINEKEYLDRTVILNFYNSKNITFEEKYSLTNNQISSLKKELQILLGKFNSIYRTSYQIITTLVKLNQESIGNNVLNKLSDNKIEKKENQYELIGFKLKREKEDEYLAVIPFEIYTGLPKIFK